MKTKGVVQGSAAQAVPLIVGVDTVYVHTDIKRVPASDENENESLFSYHEVQYDKDEYIQMMAQKNIELEGLINTMLGVE